MTTRIVGLVMLVSGCSGAGFVLASTYSARAVDLADCRAALALLETEVCFYARPLAEALESAAGRSRRVGRAILGEASRGLKRGRPAADAWQAALSLAADQSSLREEDLAVLAELGPALGNSPADEQRRHIRGVTERLGAREVEARARQAEEGRLWSYAGVLGGLALAAILL